MNDKIWFSAYLYGGEISSHMILDEFIPDYLKKGKKKATLMGFFFVRYWDEKGLHVRLRIKADQEDISLYLKPLLEKEYFLFLEEDNALVRYVPYEPEISRYGGVDSIAIAEEHFELSSLTVLELMSEYDLSDYSTALSIALQLQFVFILSLPLEKTTLLLFLNQIIYEWMPRAIPLSNDQSEDIELEELRKRCLQDFMNNYGKVKEQLIPRFTVIRDEVSAGTIKDINEILGKWYEKNHEVMIRLKESLSEEAVFMNVCGSLLHMTNNRMGLRNADESYLAYLLYRLIADN
nr:thiopeptide-type bacteriocin biosynthesis protein [uncultured Chryseobacterium sp.]